MARRIGIIGSGNIGAELGRKFRKVGHQVWITNSRGPESLKEFAAETGATPATIAEVLLNSDVIIVSIPQKNITDLPRERFAQLSPDVILVDTGNYYPARDGVIQEMEDDLPHSQWVANHLGHLVVKAFNNITFLSLINGELPSGHPDRIALAVAGDNAEQKTVLTELIDSIGFDVVDSGLIADSWRQQPGTPVYCTDYNRAGVTKALSQAVREESAHRRDYVMSKLDINNPNLIQWLRDQSMVPFEEVQRSLGVTDKK